MKFTYGRQEKLKSKKAIEQLFIEGNSVSAFPLRFVFLKKEHTSQFPLQVGVSVPKRKIPQAVDRNRIKRIFREVYRHNKHEFTTASEEKYIGMFLYLDNKEWEQDALTFKVKKLALKFIEKTKLAE